tara:strand:- start:1548 stop:1775 length:228 start_codon:yes stop_codon:yes gene_type:complete
MSTTQPDPEHCCALCSGISASRTLYLDVARTVTGSCDVLILHYSYSAGWVCQFYSDDGTSATAAGEAPSIAYLPR